MMNGNSNDTENNETKITLIAKFGKERITLDGLSSQTTILHVKEMLTERTGYV